MADLKKILDDARSHWDVAIAGGLPDGTDCAVEDAMGQIFERDCETGEFTDKLLIDGIKKDYNDIWKVFIKELDARSLLWGRPCEHRDLSTIAQDILTEKNELRIKFDEVCAIIQFEKSENGELRKLKNHYISEIAALETDNEDKNNELETCYIDIKKLEATHKTYINNLKITHNKEIGEYQDKIIKLMKEASDLKGDIHQQKVDIHQQKLEIIALKKVNKFAQWTANSTKLIYNNLVETLTITCHRYISQLRMKDIIHENYVDSMTEVESDLFGAGN